MFKNVGEKLKILALLNFALGIVCGVILAITVAQDALWVCLFLFAVPFASWVESTLLYGFGELIEKVSDTERNIRVLVGNPAQVGKKAREENRSNIHLSTEHKVEVPISDARRTREEELAVLYKEGLITNEEYNNALAKDSSAEEGENIR